jgi:NTP pyrophosphatase (non-canonical NTP hydrolase)
MNYNTLSIEAHAAAVTGGWYDTKRNSDELLTLILSEYYEAFEAYRKNKECAWIQEDMEYLKKGAKKKTKNFVKLFKDNIKDTFQDEIADTVIRILDMAGYLKLDIPYVKSFEASKEFQLDTKTFTKLIAGLYDTQITSNDIAILLGYIQGVAEFYNIDLASHIELKMAYNATRGYRHGNKKL